MRNKVIITAVFLVPLAIFACLQYMTTNYAASANSVQEQVLGKGKLIKFYSPMCSECKQVGENVKNAMKDYGDIILFEEINVSEKDQKTKDMIEAYKITVVPSVIFVDKNGRTVNKKEGMVEETEIRNYLDEIK